MDESLDASLDEEESSRDSHKFAFKITYLKNSKDASTEYRVQRT